MLKGLIYKYTNKINNKIYIGQTKDSLNQRDKRHQSKYQLADNTYFHKALKKYGRDNFDLEVIEDNIALDKLDEREIFYIREFDSYYTSGKGYNLTKGGKRSTPNQSIFGSVEKEIKKYLSETNLSYSEIRNKITNCSVSIDIISSINSGECFVEDCFDYPIRKNHKPKKTSLKQFFEIVDLLKQHSLSLQEIASKTNVDVHTVHRINQGKIKKFRNLFKDYPIRKNEKEYTFNNKISKEDVKEICRQIIFEEKKLIEICKEFGIKKNTIGDISRGITWTDVTNGLKYPIWKNRVENRELFNKNMV